MKKYIYIIIFIVILLLIFYFFNNNDNSYNYKYLKGHSFIVQDDSYLILNNDKTFYWYKDKNNKEEYYYGTYSIYRGENAIKYISKTLSIYDLSEEYQRDFIKQKELDNAIDYYYNLNLHNDKLVTKDKEEKMFKETRYYGIASDDYKRFSFINMDASNYALFILDK